MIESNSSEIIVNELMERIRVEVEKLRVQIEVPSAVAKGDSETKACSSVESNRHSIEPNQGAPQFETKDGGHKLSDFLPYQRGEFLWNAYEGILSRPPDPTGYNHYLQKLEQGLLTKVEILGRLRYAREGRGKSVKVRGLLPAFLLHSCGSIPFVGYLLRLMVAFIRLPTIVREFQTLAENIPGRFLEIKQHLEQGLEPIQSGLTVLQSEVSGLQSGYAAFQSEVSGLHLGLTVLQSEISGLQSGYAALQSEVSGLHSGYAAFQSEVSGLHSGFTGFENEIRIVESAISDIRRQIRDHKLSILDQQRSLTLLLEEVRKNLPEPMRPEGIKKMLSEEEHLMDAFYLTFEDVFRGTREDIKARQQIYLPYIQEAGAGAAEAPILDVGCGRGEWLELLGEKGLQSVGLDRNRVMIHQCEELGLKVIGADLMDFLRSQESNTFGAITAFHVVEHLPLKTMINFIDESLRVLIPGGIFILETPNPQNILVGACNFYIDPTHKNPIYPHTLDFIVSHRGFSDCNIRRLHPLNFHSFDEDAPESLQKILSLFNEAQDYAVICKK